MTWFLAYWLIGEGVLWIETRRGPFDLPGTIDEMVEDTMGELEYRGVYHPDLDGLVRRVAIAVALTIFLVLPLFWPLGLLLGRRHD